MNDFFSEQKDILVAIKHEISLLYQQVDYLIRHEKPLDILDLDVMMNRTHTIYDHLCSVDAGVEVETENGERRTENGELRAESGDEELDVDPNLIRAAFGIAPEETENGERKTENDYPVRGSILVERETENGERRTENDYPVRGSILVENGSEQSDYPVRGSISVERETENVIVNDENQADDFGFILNFEPTVEKEPVDTEEEPADTEEVAVQADVAPMETEEFVPDEEEYVPDEMEKEPIPVEKEELVPVEEEEAPVPEEESIEFELDVPETLGDKLQHQEDHSLAAKLQNRSVNDLKNAIGINDKFLFVNELFSGSMEKYNKSIENLNDLKTLNGALIYMNELRIDLAWNTSNEAYKKLLELVHQKFQN